MTFTKRLFAIFSILLLLSFAALALTGYRALARAQTALEKQDYRAAVEEYIRASRFLFWRKDLYEETAFAALKGQDLATAIYYFERAPRAQRGQLALAYAYYQAGDAQSAQAAFEEGARQYQSPSFYEGLSYVLHAQNKWEEERRAVERQIQLDAGSASAHYRLGVLLTLLDPSIALPELMRAAALDGQFDSAVQTLRAAINLSASQPSSSDQMISIGRALGLIDEWELARAAFQNAADLDPQNPEAWAWLGEAKQHTAEDPRADLERAQALDPKSPIVLGLRALYWERQQNYQQSLADYLLAARYDSQNPVWQASLGGAYAKTGDLISALEAYQRATQLESNESEYWRMLALFCAENGVNVEELGLPAAQKAAALAPDDPLALDVLGYAYYSTGRYANAESILTGVTARFPTQYSAHIHLAMNYLAQGNSAAAYASLTFVRDANPHGADGELAARLLEKYFP